MNLKSAALVLCTISIALAQNHPDQGRLEQGHMEQGHMEQGHREKDQPTNPKAELIFIHGNIYTGVAGASSFQEIKRVEAMAIRGDRIQAAGKEDEILKLKGPQTEVINLSGHFVMPGFNDAHLHLANAGDIDEVTTEHPVFLQRVDGHIAVANTRALRLASITIASKDPAGGKIDRDSTGQPTGILRETAREAVAAVIPKPTHDKRRQALEAALLDLARWGITSAQDNSSWEDFQIYEELEREGKLAARISEWLAFDDPLDTLQAHRSAHPQSDTMLHTGMLKGFMDGSLGSRTAALIEPYADDPRNSGLPQYDQAKLTQMTKERVQAGFQVGFHAIGDKGVQMALDAFAAAICVGTAAPGFLAEQSSAVPPSNSPPSLRLRIEHTQVTTPLQIATFKELKVIASMQPSHLLTDMNWAEAGLGPKRAEHSYAWAEFLKKGVTLAFGTDYPVEPVTPFRGLYAAVTRKSEDGKKEYFPEQKLTMEQAIAAYTTGSAFAKFAENDKGTLAPGMLADFVVLDREVTSVPPPKVLETRVLRTVVAGKTVYEAK